MDQYEHQQVFKPISVYVVHNSWCVFFEACNSDIDINGIKAAISNENSCLINYSPKISDSLIGIFNLYVRMETRKILSLVVFALVFNKIESSNDCSTPDCISLVNSIKNSIDSTVEPCDDFYEYACGKWGEHNQIPSGKDIWDVTHIMSQNILEKLIEMLNDGVESSNTTEAFRKAKRMYQSCMNLEAIENNGINAILQYFNKTGGWPAIMPYDNWTSSGKSIQKIRAYHIKNLNLQLFCEFNVYSHGKNSTKKSLHIDPFGILPFPYFLKNNARNSSKVAQWIGNITEIVKILADKAGNDVKIEDIQNDINNVIDIEYSLLEIWNHLIEFKDDEPVYMTVNEFQIWYNNNSHSDNSKIVWIDLFQTLFNDTELKFTENSTIVISSPNYIKKIRKLLDSTPARTIVNYIQYSALKKLMRGAPKELRDITFKMQQKLKKRGQPKREETCLHTIGFEHALNYEYVKRHVHPETKQLMNEIITGLSHAANEVLNETAWLQSDRVTLINQQLSTMKRFINYPEWYDTPSAVDDYYQQCTIGDNFVENIIEVTRFQRHLSMSELARPIDKPENILTATSLNQRYFRKHNALVLPAASLQVPLFSPNYPRVSQYAQLGSIIGHEISHVFYTPTDMDDDFNISNLSEEEKKIIDKAQCFVEQYNQYKTYEADDRTIFVDGERTKNENIADLTGLDLAYRALQNAKSLKNVNLRSSGLEYTDDQLFFLSFAQHLCSVAQPAYYKKTARRKSQSVSKFRVIGALSNMKEFSTAFNCSINSAMNSLKKCAVWGTSI